MNAVRRRQSTLLCGCSGEITGPEKNATLRPQQQLLYVQKLLRKRLEVLAQEAVGFQLSQAGDPRTAGNSSTYNEIGVRVHGCGKKQSPRGAQSDGRRTKTLNTLSRKYLWCTHEPVPRSSCSPTSYPQCGGRLPVIALGIPPLAGHFNMFSQQLRSAKEEQRRGTHSNFKPNFTDSRRYIHIHMHHLS